MPRLQQRLGGELVSRLRVGDVWHAACGRVYTPAPELFEKFDPECSDQETALWDWIDGIHDDRRGVRPTFCEVQKERDATEASNRALAQVGAASLRSSLRTLAELSEAARG
jgi:hypothetical protein